MNTRKNKCLLIEKEENILWKLSKNLKEDCHRLKISKKRRNLMLVEFIRKNIVKTFQNVYRSAYLVYKSTKVY